MARPKDSKEQESCIEEACSTVRSNNSKIKLLIIDSIIFHYRAEYPGRSGLPERAHRLNIHIYKLRSLAQRNNIAVVITNRMTVNSDAFEYGNPQPFGGNIVSHASAYIISLKRRKRNSIETTLIKSPLRGYTFWALGYLRRKEIHDCVRQNLGSEFHLPNTIFPFERYLCEGG